MASLATPDDLAAYLGTTLDPVQSSQAQAVLDAISGVIVLLAGTDFASHAGVTEKVDPTTEDAIVLAHYPVTAVSAVAVDGTVLTLPDDIVWYSSGLVYRASDVWGTKRQSVVVTYDYGYASVPEDIKGVCTIAAARLAANPGGDQSESVGNYAHSFKTSEGTAYFEDGEMEIITSYRTPVVA